MSADNLSTMPEADAVARELGFYTDDELESELARRAKDRANARRPVVLVTEEPTGRLARVLVSLGFEVRTMGPCEPVRFDCEAGHRAKVESLLAALGLEGRYLDGEWLGADERF